jgi:N-acetylglutamate synthase-like GNAT family acetyltransferase
MIEIRNADKEIIEKYLWEYWGSDRIVTKGRIHKPEDLSGFCAYYKKNLAGLITYRISGLELEIVTLNSLIENRGIGIVLIKRVRETALLKNLRRIWLITTNDNQKAIKYYTNRGFKRKDMYSIADSRKLKPEIPLTGFNDIEIKYEIEFEYKL